VKLVIAVACVLLGSVALVRRYERTVIREFANALDMEHGSAGWTVIWQAADAQMGQSLSIVRTGYVRFLYPHFQEYTPWDKLTFTHKTSHPKRPWHFCICTVSRTREVTYYWSIRERRWVVAWDNRIADFPVDVQQAYAAKLNSIVRRDGLNSSDE
jgi:hypothetical protein